MSMQSKESHLNGKKHFRKLGNPEEKFVRIIVQEHQAVGRFISKLSGVRDS